MKIIILNYNKKLNDYEVLDNFRTIHFELYYLIMSFDPFDDSWIYLHHLPNLNDIIIWSADSIKEMAEINFKSKQEEAFFKDEYRKYYHKREREMPKIIISSSDYQYLLEQWTEIKKNIPEYVIFTLKDSGSENKVTCLGKSQLSQQDMIMIQYEHQIYLRWQSARQKYINNHLDYSDVWRGPQDNELDADIMKYYED